MTLVHVVSGSSAAHSLRHALRLMNRDERVLVEPDDLSVGPIATHDTLAREQFYARVLHTQTFARHRGQSALFWRRGLRASETPLLWFSRFCASEYAGYLAYAASLTEPPKIIDVADLPSHGIGLHTLTRTSFAFVPSQQIVQLRLLDRARVLSTAEHRQARDQWSVLQAANSQLRTFNDAGHLVSCPLTRFDHIILDCVPRDWRRGGWVQSAASYRINDAWHRTRDSLIWGRICGLVESGALEARSDGPAGGVEIRRRPLVAHVVS